MESDEAPEEESFKDSQKFAQDKKKQIQKTNLALNIASKKKKREKANKLRDQTEGRRKPDRLSELLVIEEDQQAPQIKVTKKIKFDSMEHENIKVKIIKKTIIKPPRISSKNKEKFLGRKSIIRR